MTQNSPKMMYILSTYHFLIHSSNSKGFAVPISFKDCNLRSLFSRLIPTMTSALIPPSPDLPPPPVEPSKRVNYGQVSMLSFYSSMIHNYIGHK